jgi:hypothetical protein
MSQPFDSFAERIVRNGEYKQLCEAIRRVGGESAAIRIALESGHVLDDILQEQKRVESSDLTNERN